VPLILAAIPLLLLSTIAYNSTSVTVRVENKYTIICVPLKFNDTVLVEVFNVDFSLADSPSGLNRRLGKILKAANIPVIRKCKYEFTPQGLSMVYILAASHLAIHTWPEKGYLHLDLVTCTEETDLDLFVIDVKKYFPEAQVNVFKMKY
jgi:S-adenosylmethionine decarboxylase proenzyme